MVQILQILQFISYDQKKSEPFRLTYRVPQGSCSLLFVLYASKLFEVIKQHLPQAHAYANDTQQYLSFKADSAFSESNAIAAMEKCIKAIRSWMIKDKLTLDDSKTEFIIIGTRQQLAIGTIDCLSVGETR